MLKSLQINNIQSHVDTRIEFCPGINVIIGPSGTGKSSIIRAIMLVIRNKPKGLLLLRHDEEGYSIILDNVQKVRSSKENYYKINNKKLDSGQIVPDEIKNYFNFCDTNYSEQIELNFLLHHSSGEVARYLNNIIDLGIITKSLQRAETMKNKLIREIEYVNSDINSINTKIEKYTVWLPGIIEKTKKIKNEYEEYKKINGDIFKFKKLRISLHEIKEKLNIIVPGIPDKKIKKYKKILKILDIAYHIEDLQTLLVETNSVLKSKKKEKREILPNGSICPLCNQGIVK